MSRRHRRSGVVPRSRRGLFAGACAAVAVVAIVGGLCVNWFTSTPVRWAWLFVSAGFVVGLYALYLWIRLADD